MKTILQMTIIFLAIAPLSYGQANTSLSNLVSPTTVNQSLIPNNNNGRDLGTATKSWRSIYLDSIVYLRDARFIHNKGTQNTFVGEGAGNAITTGKNNAAFGYQALYKNTTGGANTAIGTYALNLNKTGQQNTATGYATLVSNTNGSFNTANGTAALNYNSTGTWNTANGDYAMYLNTIGYNNTATGGNALYSNTEGGYNTAYGYNALYNNSTAYFNTAVGGGALSSNTTGSVNTAVGSVALADNTTGSGNTAVGRFALAHSSGSGNTALGNHAGDENIAGNSNTYIGEGATPNAGNLDYSTALGSGSRVSASNQVRLGDNNVTSIGGYADWTNISDGRVKKNIKGNVPGLAFINKLNPITYNLNLDAADKIIQKTSPKDKDGKTIQFTQVELISRKAKEQIVYTGFVAQDVEKVAKGLNYDFSGVDAAKNDKDLYGLRYAEFVVPLVKAVQELSAQNDELKKENETQKKINADLKDRLSKLEALVNTSQPINTTSVNLTAASLEQNIPNPVTNTAIINCTLPQKFTSAQIVITDKNGKTLKAINISGNKGNVKVDASTLASGAYQYSLIVDGKLIDTKQMEHIK
jgi:hypothetical protein